MSAFLQDAEVWIKEQVTHFEATLRKALNAQVVQTVATDAAKVAGVAEQVGTVASTLGIPGAPVITAIAKEVDTLATKTASAAAGNRDGHWRNSSPSYLTSRNR